GAGLMRAIACAAVLLAALPGGAAHAQSSDATLTQIRILAGKGDGTRLATINYAATGAAGCTASGIVHTCSGGMRDVSVAVPDALGDEIVLEYTAGDGGASGVINVPANAPLPAFFDDDEILEIETFPIPLSGGVARVLTTTVTAADMTTTLDYRVTVTRMGSDRNDPNNPTLDKVNLVGNFDALYHTIHYATSGAAGCASSGAVHTCSGGARDITLQLESHEEFFYLEVFLSHSSTETGELSVPAQTEPPLDAVFDDQFIGGASEDIDLSPGGAARVVTTVFTAPDNVTMLTYRITISRMVSVEEDDATLSILNPVPMPDVSPRPVLRPEFDLDFPERLMFEMDLPPATETLRVFARATEQAGGASIVSIDGSAPETDMHGDLFGDVALSPGMRKIILIVVQAVDETLQTYTLTAITGRADNADLRALSLSGDASLAPDFTPDETTYTAMTTAAGVRVTPVVSQLPATVSVDGTAVASGAPSGEIELDVNMPKAIAVVVTAPNGSATKTYSVTVTRVLSANADLSGLTLSAGGATLSPPFAADRIAYTASVESGIAGITVTPVLADSNATVTVDGGAADTEIPLVVNTPKAIVVVVTAEDAATTKTYTVTVTRLQSADATLAGLEVSAGALAFASTTTSYAVAAPNSAAEIAITATPNHTGAAFTLQIGEAAYSSTDL
ncbi:MAG: cadherin-like beta sandwich domain-containing protein, partial [Gammaproteobacteria bacterium]